MPGARGPEVLSRQPAPFDQSGSIDVSSIIQPPTCGFLSSPIVPALLSGEMKIAIGLRFGFSFGFAM